MTIKKKFAPVVCFLSLILLVGCKEEKPKDILSKETMTVLLMDIYIGEGKVSSLSLKRDSSLAIFDAYEKRIFEKHQIDREQYKKSLAYYYDNPLELEEIYDRVLDSLNLKEQKLKESKKTVNDEEERKRDPAEEVE